MDDEPPLHGIDAAYHVIPFGPSPPAENTTRCLWLRHLDKVKHLKCHTLILMQQLMPDR